MPKRTNVSAEELVGPASPRRAPRRTIHVRLDGDYEGFEFEWWRNPPGRLLDEIMTAIQTGDNDTLERLICERVVSHNFVDFDGNPIPQGVAGIKEWPSDLFSLVLTAADRAVRESFLPNE